MHGDLEIQIFFWASAFLAGVEAMKATDWRRWTFWGVCGLFTLIGLAWIQIKEVYPPLTRWITEIATSPQSWFVLIVLGLVLVAITGRKPKSVGVEANDSEITVGEIVTRLFQIEKENEANNNDLRHLINDVMQKQAALEVELKQTDADKIQQNRLNDRIVTLARGAHLLAYLETERLTRRVLKQLQLEEPKYDYDEDISQDTALMKERTLLLESFARLVESNVASSKWGHDIGHIIRSAANDEDRNLKAPGRPLPSGPNAFLFREYAIAQAKRRAATEFLKRAIIESERDEMSYLSRVKDEMKQLDAARR